MRVAIDASFLAMPPSGTGVYLAALLRELPNLDPDLELIEIAPQPASRPTEGESLTRRIAGKIAAEEFGRPIKWLEAESRDTRENAARTMALLKAAGVEHIVLVTHGYHMPRALRAFREAAGPGVEIDAAPMGLARRVETPALDWMPSARGFTTMRQVLREVIGKLAGA